MIFRKIFDLLSPNGRRRAFVIMGLTLFMALIDMVGAASIMPFIALLANTELIETNSWLRAIYVYFEFSDYQMFLYAVGIVMFAVLIISLAFKSFTFYVLSDFSLMQDYNISRRLVNSYLHQPYSWFLERHSADLGKTILSEVNAVVFQAIQPFMTLVAQVCVTFGLVAMLLVIDPELAISVITTISMLYIFIFKFMSQWLDRLGVARLGANQERFKAVIEAFGAIKVVKATGLEEVYSQRFARPAKIYAKSQATSQVITQLPRFILEAIAFGGMMLVMLYLVRQRGNLSNAMPIIALYAFAGYRLFPALQQIYASLAQLRFAEPAINALHDDLMNLENPEISKRWACSQVDMRLRNSITLTNVVYSYKKGGKLALCGLNMVIPARSTVGFIGPTGSGKTTAADIILGLLEPQQGSISIDGELITRSNMPNWQKIIGYVPQHIFLADSTLSENIAFGLVWNDINHEAVERAARIANLHDFVVNDLPEGYRTIIGENGVRLSGGQRQRIGIARALYNNPQVLIMDEATSALDNLTEKAVMDAVNNLGGEITIILIAHRLGTVRKCETIFMFENGVIKSSGSYGVLKDKNADFQRLLEASK